MNTIKLVSAGFGGQGVLTIGQLVAMSGMKKDYAVSWLPSYGPEMRGGTANCHVVVDEKEVGSPLISSGITHLVAMNQPALDKFLPHCANDAIIIRHKALTVAPQLHDAQKDVAFDFSQLALDFGNPKVLNMAALGVLWKYIPEFNLKDGLEVINEKIGSKNKALMEVDDAVFEAAYQSK